MYGDTSQSLAWQSLCRQLWLFVHWGLLSLYWERAEKTPVTALYFISQDPAEMFPSLYVWESVCSGYHSAADWGSNPEVKLSLNCCNHLICVSKASVPVFAQFSWQHKNGLQVHKSFSWEALGLEALTGCETRLVSRNIKFSYWYFLWVRLSGKLQKAGKLLHRNFEAELRSKVLQNARAAKWNGCLFVSISHVSLLSQL